MYMHGRSYFTNRLITSDVKITSEWREIDPKGQIESIADSNFITIDLEDPFVMKYRDKKITAPDVEGFHPEIKVVDKDGVEYFFVMAGSTGENRIRYRYTDNRKLPIGKTYTKLFIRSDVPFTARSIFFTYYYVKDMG
jgi:hypothetical protein